MKKKIKKVRLIVSLIFAAAITAACSRSEKKTADDDSLIKVFFVNNEFDQVLAENSGIKREELTLENLLGRLEEGPENADCVRILGEKTSLEDYRLDDAKTLTLNFDEGYGKLGRTEEVLFRMSLVNTFTQMDDVYYLSISVNSAPLKLDDETEVGFMTANSFIENAGREISAYSKTTLHLYFADSSGTKLIRTDKSLVYSSNISMEKLVADNLIEGPPDDSTYPTISPDTKINSIDVRDGVCYCDFDSSLTDQATNVSEEAVFYSIVNSLCELRGVTKVQISIDGETDRVFIEKIELDRPYTRSLDIVERK